MPEFPIIRPSTPRDLAQIDLMLARSYPRLLKGAYPPSVLVLALPLISRAQPALVRSGTYFVAETRSGGIVGAGGWTRDPRAVAVADIRHVVTDADHTRQGIGRRLFSHIFDTARAAGIESFDCQATRTAVPFYLAMGFRVLGPITLNLRPGIEFPAVAMRCRAIWTRRRSWRTKR